MNGNPVVVRHPSTEMIRDAFMIPLRGRWYVNVGMGNSPLFISGLFFLVPNKSACITCFFV